MMMTTLTLQMKMEKHLTELIIRETNKKKNKILNTNQCLKIQMKNMVNGTIKILKKKKTTTKREEGIEPVVIEETEEEEEAITEDIEATEETTKEETEILKAKITKKKANNDYLILVYF